MVASNGVLSARNGLLDNPLGQNFDFIGNAMSNIFYNDGISGYPMRKCLEMESSGGTTNSTNGAVR